MGTQQTTSASSCDSLSPSTKASQPLFIPSFRLRPPLPQRPSFRFEREQHFSPGRRAFHYRSLPLLRIHALSTSQHSTATSQLPFSDSRDGKSATSLLQPRLTTTKLSHQQPPSRCQTSLASL